MSTPTRDASRLTRPGRRVVLVRLGEEPLDLAAFSAAVADPAAGAIATFAGNVRDHDHGAGVRELEYVAHPSAADVLARVVAEVVADADVDAVAVGHRLGHLAIGDCALAVAVSAAHRAEAFAACARLVDEVKDRVPIWKHQHLQDGTSEWVACP